MLNSAKPLAATRGTPVEKHCTTGLKSARSSGKSAKLATLP